MSERGSHAGSRLASAAALALLTPLLLVVTAAGEARAHPLAPALLEIRELGDGAAVTWKTPAFGAPGARLRPLLPPGCEATTKPRTTADDTTLSETWSVACGGLAGARLGVDGLDRANTQALLRLVFADGRVVSTVLTARQPSFTVPREPQPLTVAADYARLGIEHIATGADHLLFVLGLLLLIPATGTLARAITGFTLGHSITLSLAALGWASVPSRPIELCIALSVLALAIELTRADRATLLRRFPWAVAAAFGLLHGLGFAGALREIGLPAADLPLALFSFNGGIELGQLAFVAAILAAGGALRRLPLRMPRWAPQVPVYAMGSLAVLWTLQRAAALLP